LGTLDDSPGYVDHMSFDFLSTQTPFDTETFSPLASCSPSPTIATSVLGSQTPPIVTTSEHLGSGSALLVTNLPAMLFSSDSDLHPLFCPYGEVKNIKRLPGGLATTTEGTISVIVEYQSSDQAREARDMLHGQAYANQPLNVDFMNPAPTPPRSALDQWDAAIADVKARLNPNATPFSMHGSFGQDISNRVSSFAKERGLGAFEHHNASNLPSGLVGSPYQPTVPMMPRPVLYNSLCPPAVNPIRPNSAPGRWTEQPRLARPAQWTCSSQDLPSLASGSMLSTYSA